MLELTFRDFESALHFGSEIQCVSDDDEGQFALFV